MNNDFYCRFLVLVDGAVRHISTVNAPDFLFRILRVFTKPTCVEVKRDLE